MEKNFRFSCTSIFQAFILLRIRLDTQRRTATKDLLYGLGRMVAGIADVESAMLLYTTVPHPVIYAMLYSVFRIRLTI